MKHEEKAEIIADLKQHFVTAQATYLANFRGCTCAELTDMKRKLQPVGAKCVVVKNTLMKRAFQDADGIASALEGHLKGPTCVIWAKADPVSPAKVLTEFAKKVEKFQLKAGIIDGQVIDVPGIEALAKLPSKKEVQGQLLSLLNAVATQVVRVLNAPGTNMVRLLEAWRKELEEKKA